MRGITNFKIEFGVICIGDNLIFKVIPISAVNNINTSGPRTLPYGIPDITSQNLLNSVRIGGRVVFTLKRKVFNVNHYLCG